MRFGAAGERAAERQAKKGKRWEKGKLGKPSVNEDGRVVGDGQEDDQRLLTTDQRRATIHEKGCTRYRADNRRTPDELASDLIARQECPRASAVEPSITPFRYSKQQALDSVNPPHIMDSPTTRPLKAPRIYTCRICAKIFKRSEHCSRHERGRTFLFPFLFPYPPAPYLPSAVANPYLCGRYRRAAIRM